MHITSGLAACFIQLVCSVFIITEVFYFQWMVSGVILAVGLVVVSLVVVVYVLDNDHVTIRYHLEVVQIV